MATPNDIYNIPVEAKDISHSPCDLVGTYYNHIPEIDDFELDYNVKPDEVEIKEVFFESIDHRRYYQVRSVFFKGKPVMIVQNAGREGDDHHDRFITDIERYKEMINFIKSLMKINDFKQAEHDIAEPDKEDETLLNFYGCHLKLDHGEES